jgi:hypothetical protein
MLDILRQRRYYLYPHFHWAAAIQKVLATTAGIVRDDVTLIDAPCGPGGISYWLIKRNVGSRYELCDISPRAIQRAMALQSWGEARGVKVSVACKDIFELDTSSPARDIWLLINSLFLLPDVDRLVEHMSRRVQHVVGLFPHLDRRNYRCYVRRMPKTNIHPMNREEVATFFQTHGYRLRATQDVTFIPFHCIPTRSIQYLALHLLNPVEYLVPKHEGYYWIGVFSK